GGFDLGDVFDHVDGPATGTVFSLRSRGGDHRVTSKTRIFTDGSLGSSTIRAVFPADAGARQNSLAQLAAHIVVRPVQPAQQRPVGAKDVVVRIVNENIVRDGVEGARPLASGLHHLLHQLAVLGGQAKLFGSSLEEILLLSGVSTEVRQAKHENADPGALA